MAPARVSNNLRKQRFAAGEMTQQELGDRVGVTRQTIAAIESQKHSPSLELAFQIAEVFGLELTELFSYDGDQD